jgi:hypothetical protein
MQLADDLSVLAVLVAATSLAITLWNVRRTMEREDGRARADLVLRYSENTCLIDVDDEGPTTALQVSLLATGPKLSLDLQSLGTIPAGETRQYRVTAAQDFLAYLFLARWTRTSESEEISSRARTCRISRRRLA